MGKKIQHTVTIGAGSQFATTSVDLSAYAASFPMRLIELDFACGSEAKDISIRKYDSSGAIMSELFAATASEATSVRLQGEPHSPLLMPLEDIQVVTVGATAAMRLYLLFEIEED